MSKIKVLMRNIATRDCTVGREYEVIQFTPEGETDPDGYRATQDSYSFIDDVGDRVTTHLYGVELVEDDA